MLTELLEIELFMPIKTEFALDELQWFICYKNQTNLSLIIMYEYIFSRSWHKHTKTFHTLKCII